MSRTFSGFRERRQGTQRCWKSVMMRSVICSHNNWSLPVVAGSDTERPSAEESGRRAVRDAAVVARGTAG